MFFARLFSLSISCLAAAGAAEKFSFERPLMGTKFSVICYAESRAVAAKAVAAAFLKAEQVNEVASGSPSRCHRFSTKSWITRAVSQRRRMAPSIQP
jgi:hypothetical protein